MYGGEWGGMFNVVGVLGWMEKSAFVGRFVVNHGSLEG